MPDINAMKSFLVAADTLNFSRVAKQRNTVQSAVSLHIKKLEEELGCKLFERGRGQNMKLTPEGHAFVSYARRILTLNAEAVQSIRKTKSVRTIRIGTTVTLAMSVVSEAIREFTSINPAVQLHVHCDRSDALLAKLDAGEIDVAFMMDQGKRASRDFVENVPLAWVSGPGFMLDEADDVPLVFLTDGRDLRRYAFEALDRVNRKGYLAHLSSHPIGVHSLVLADLALTVLPQISVPVPLRIASDIRDLPSLKNVVLSLYRKSEYNSDIDVLSSIIHSQIIQSNAGDFNGN
ncbi:LysR family transcriptional regulator [Lentilitoribacter sp. Alg239-R112]|uniref:LysR family transcriptional regulator n=1 Tax=Lentilitoribacter sp. Alg239-R112 TaxID=2305987 RepID=UPI0013A6A306|nr:LysR family transcriptional regulator [Lentilitoribacter sp. Alg239-R112]